MPKQKERPEMPNGGAGGGYDPVTHESPHPMPPPPPPPQPRAPANPPAVGNPIGGPGARLDVPTMRPPGFSAAPGAYIGPHGGRGSWQAPGFPPPPAFTDGVGPQSVHQLEPPLPIGTKATHFSGPLVSGGIPQSALWRLPHQIQGATPVGGTPILTTTFTVDWSMGNFSVTTQFPPNSLIISFAGVTAVPFTASPTFQLGSLSGGSDILTAGTFPAPGTPITFNPATGQLPLWDATGLQQPFQAFLTVNGNTGGTAGLGIILIQFLTIPQRWT